VQTEFFLYHSFVFTYEGEALEGVPDAADVVGAVGCLGLGEVVLTAYVHLLLYYQIQLN
jgi:hypothetical protein